MNPPAIFAILLALGLLEALRRMVPKESNGLARRAVATMAAAFLIGGATIAAIWMLRPSWLGWILLTAVAIAAVAWWFFRPGYGAGSSLPPGSLSPLDSVRAVLDRDFYRQRFESHGPIFKMMQFHRPVICILGIERGKRLIRNHHSNLSAALQAFSRDVSGGFLRYMSPEVHSRYAPRIRAAMRAGVVDEAGGDIDAALQRELGRFADRPGNGSAPGFDPKPMVEAIAMSGLTRAMLGITSREAIQELDRLYRPLVDQPLDRTVDAAAQRSLDRIREIVRRRLTEPSSQPASSALAALAVDGHGPLDDIVIDNLIFMIVIGRRNLSGLMMWILEMLARHPESARRAGSGEAVAADETPIEDRIVHETLRLSQSEYVYRVATEDIDFEGFRLPRGWMIRCCVAESHLDPDAFEDPESFRPERFRQRPDPQTFSPFGSHHHACNAVPMVYAICRSFVREISTGFDWQLVSDGPVTRPFRHWEHWRPSPRLRIALRRSP